VTALAGRFDPAVVEKLARMSLWDDARNESGGDARPVPDLSLSSDTQRRLAERVHEVLVALAQDTDLNPKAAVLLALSDDETGNLYGALAKEGLPFSAGAMTRHIFNAIRPMLGMSKSPDREQRDYWIYPLTEVGLVQRIYVATQKELKDGADLIREGHGIGNSNNNAYRLDPEFVQLLSVSDADWPTALQEFIAGDEQRRLRAVQSWSADVSSSHTGLIHAAVEALLHTRLEGFELLLVDEGGEARTESKWSPKLAEYGLHLRRNDRWPDAILGNSGVCELWVVDAITNDGEVDIERRDAIAAWAERHGWYVGGFITAYLDWKYAAQRQGRMKNIAIGTYMWVAEDGGKLWLAEQLDDD
jgi:hypothetical protein